MATKNSVLKDKALTALKGKWGGAVVLILVYSLILVVLGGSLEFARKGIGNIVTFLISPPLAFGITNYFISLYRGKEVELNLLFSGFSEFGRVLLTYILMLIGVIIGLLLLIVPGIILAIGLSQTYFILVDNKEISAIDALKASWEMMKGHKMKFFLLNLSFIGWVILCVFTLFIGFFWLAPYIYTTLAAFYEDINGRSEVNEIEEIGTV